MVLIFENSNVNLHSPNEKGAKPRLGGVAELV
jgi:hypothetical protein